MQKTLIDQLSQYAAYHRDRRNIATHFIGVPMIVLAVQTLLARLPPEAILRETDANRFPLTPDEMRWHIEFLSKMSR